MPSIHGPSDLLPRILKDLSARLLPRLRLIPEFRCWLPPISEIGNCTGNLLGPKTSQSSVLWQSLSQGVPLEILLDLLGSKIGGSSLAGQGTVNDQDVNKTFIAEFLRRVEILEIQGHLSYGEAFRVDEFLDGSCSGFIKVLKTVQRVLDCLEATYPNLYELPNIGDRRKEDLFEQFLDLESLYLEDLRDMKDCIDAMVDESTVVQEHLTVPIERMIQYQEHIISHLQSFSARSTDSIQWHHLFGMKENMYILGAGAYQSYCSQFYALVDFVDAVCIKSDDDELQNERCFELSRQLTLPLSHILSLVDTCSAALEITHPVENPSTFEALCSAFQNLLTLKDDIFEVMKTKRSAYAVRYITSRTPHARIDMSYLSLGEFVLDDCVRAQIWNISGQNQSRQSTQSSRAESENPNKRPEGERETGTFVYAFLFEKMLLLGKPIVTEVEPHVFTSHILRSDRPSTEWDLGPAIRAGTLFDVLCVVSLAELVHVERQDTGLAINMTWTGRGEGSTNTLFLTFQNEKQLEPWIRVLSHLAPSDTVSVDISEYEERDGKHLESSHSLSWLDELEFSRGRSGSKPRPWSLIARRKEALASSLYLTLSDNASERSFFSYISSPASGNHRHSRGLSKSPARSISSVLSSKSAVPIADPSKLAEAIQSMEGALPAIAEDSDDPPDLTGEVRRIGKYPAAHGGFSDVWKCNWITGPQCYKVAVKVLRGKLLDAEREDKMMERLAHEIKVWKRLDHENIVPLHGTCSDFGRYLSLVCPWHDNGTLYQYVRKNTDLLNLSERLRLLSDIAAGLSYLHSSSIIHGDLSSVNVLINDNGRACLCDFGLSTLVEDLVDSWYPSSMLGGAIRWSAPELYCIARFDNAEPPRPRASVSSDTYSFGSIALEILSGKVPYYYLKHDGQVLIELSKRVKPERTPSPFLTNDLWDLIRECWNDNPGARPSTARVSSQIGVLRQRTASRHSL